MKSKAKKEQKQNGFTLIELMIIVAVIGIMTTVGFVSLKADQNQTRLKIAQAEIVAMLKLAQSYALQGKEQSGVVPAYYGVRFVGNSGYELCMGDINCGTSLETYQLKDGVLSDAIGKSVLFDVPYGNCTLVSGLTVTLSLSGNTRAIVINPGGAITEN